MPHYFPIDKIQKELQDAVDQFLVVSEEVDKKQQALEIDILEFRAQQKDKDRKN